MSPRQLDLRQLIVEGEEIHVAAPVEQDRRGADLQFGAAIVGIKLVLHPEWARFEEGFESARSDAEVCLENALELEQGFVVERDRGEIVG